MRNRKSDNPWSRRRFLRGAGGVTLGLPMLDLFAREREVRGQAARPYVPAVFMVNSCGVVQNDDGPEMFWPSKAGPLTTASLMADSGRTAGELAAHAARLIFVRGINFRYSGIAGCGHAEGGCQVLTANGVTTGGRNARAKGESIDHRIARELNPSGRESLLLYAGRKGTWIDDFCSYRGPQQLRAGQNNPWNAYRDVIGLGGGGASTTPLPNAAAEAIKARRRSVNDLVREEMQALLARTDLSADDRERLKLHADNIRDIETTITTTLAPPEKTPFEALNAAYADDASLGKVARLHAELAAFALASRANRVAVIQVGAGADRTRRPEISGYSYHRISHRVDSDGASGASISGARMLHHKIDRLHAQYFNHLLDKMAAYTTPEGNLLDIGFAVWTNELATGPGHRRTGVPYVIAGRARGYLRAGQFVDVGGQLNNKLLNTLLNAAGIRKAGGAPVDDFGAAELPKGELAEIKNA
jgi:hypothetical protein